MTLKELVRAAICGEMEDISACEVDAAAFGRVPAGEKAAALYDSLVEEKKSRLLELGRILKEGTGFRKRSIEVSRSLEASLRARAVRAEKASLIYTDLMRALNKPEFKEAMKALALRERAIGAEIKALREGLKK
ncbi:MAG TPA: hypothetical protein DEQ38_09305 [Elusimicrobia bacterium]|nr:MAG: hypothetical protein A2089_13710 [Elusimicrobia bacterium GWD2_63_28]HCC48291.1 hypothetical protein [Elusimicrobiota bacterium]